VCISRIDNGNKRPMPVITLTKVSVDLPGKRPGQKILVEPFYFGSVFIVIAVR